jgi:AcrR family transcriptional regulator
VIAFLAVPKIVDHDQRRDDLAKAAVKVIDREGIEGATLREIAKEAGYSTGIIGHYFESRNDVLVAALGYCMSQATERMAALGEVHRGLKSLHEMAQELLPLDKRRTRENRVWLLYGAEALTARRLRREYLSLEDRISGLLRQALAQAIEDGELDSSVDSELEANRLLALNDGISLAALFDRDYWTDDRQVDAMDVHLDDLRRRGRAAVVAEPKAQPTNAPSLPTAAGTTTKTNRRPGTARATQRG